MMTSPAKTPAKRPSRAYRWFHAIFDLESSGDLFLYSALVGIVAATGAWGFAVLLHWTTKLTYGYLMGIGPPVESAAGVVVAEPLSGIVWWAILIVPTLGGLVCGWIVFTYAPETEGHGTDAVVKAFHRLQGVVRARAIVVKTIASVITIGTGGSAGREGPIAQIGAGFGSLLATKLKLSPVYRRTLMLCGAAGGIAAIFQAPLGGALFVCEVLYSSTAVEFSVVIAAVIASLTAYSFYIWLCHFTEHFAWGIEASRELHVGEAMQNFTVSVGEYPFYLVFAIICALVGFLYVKTFYGVRDHFFHKIPIANMFKPAIGGLMLGIMVLVLHVPGHLPHGMPHVMGGGYAWIQLALDGELLGNVWWVIALLCLAKIVATSLTISSGGSGGVFAPSLFIGGMLGAAYGQLCHQLFPGQIVHPEVFVLVGMGGFFAGVAKVPLTSVLMVCEMTGGYDLLVPLMLVSFVNVGILSSHISLYEEQVRSLIDSPAHFGDFVIDVLAELKVDEVYNRNRPVQLVPQSMPLSQVVRLVAASHNSHFPVVDSQQKMVGIFSLSDIRAAFEGGADDALIFAQDIAVFPVITVTPDDDLHTALRRCTQKNIDELPIVSPEDPQKVLGMLRRKELIAAYSQKMAALREVR